jgi:hypothetical protein
MHGSSMHYVERGMICCKNTERFVRFEPWPRRSGIITRTAVWRCGACCLQTIIEVLDYFRNKLSEKEREREMKELLSMDDSEFVQTGSERNSPTESSASLVNQINAILSLCRSRIA